MHPTTVRPLKTVTPLFLLAALTIELLDELVDGVGGAAWPAIRVSLSLSYLQIGLLLGLPTIIGSLLDPLLGLLADGRWRRRLILGGGMLFAASLALMALSAGFWALLTALTLFSPASGAFVTLMQATLMDADPARREQNMARWTLAGSVGNVVGPLLIGLSALLGEGWRPVYLLLAVLTGAVIAVLWRRRSVLDAPAEPAVSLEPSPAFRELWQGAVSALRRQDVRRALVMLECANLMLDVLRGFVALYFVDVAGTDAAGAALAVTVFTGVGLLGDALILPVLERVPGAAYLRLSAAFTATIFPLFLLAPQLGVKLVLLGLLGLLNAGWYAVLQARLYTLLPERSGTVVALGSVAGIAAGVIPFVLGVLAQRFGVQAALWLLLLGPLTLLLWLPGTRSDMGSEGADGN